MSDASCQQNGAAAAALEALAWLDDDEAAALETLFGAGACDAPAALRCAPRPASPSAHDSEGGSSGRASACTAARAPQPFASPRGHGDAPRSTTRLDGLRFLDADCARGCSKCAPLAPLGKAGGRERGAARPIAQAGDSAAHATRSDARRARPGQVHCRPADSIREPLPAGGRCGQGARPGEAHADSRQLLAHSVLVALCTPRADAPAAPAAPPQKNGEKKLRRCASAGP